MSGGIPPRDRVRDAQSSLVNLAAEGAVLAPRPAAPVVAAPQQRPEGDAAAAAVVTAAGDNATMLRSGTIEKIAAMSTAGEDAASRADQPKIVALVSAATENGDPRYDHFTKRLVAHPSKLGRLEAPHLSSWTRVGRFPSPFKTNPRSLNLGLSFVSNNETILVDIIGHAQHETISREFLRCGPREFIAFHPQTVNAAIVTCGGLAPGLNTVVRELVCTLSRLYGVENIYGVPYGYRGFYSPNHNLRRLTEDSVSSIHHQGGTILGSSRGGFDLKLICDAVEDRSLNQIFIIGGDGTHRGALAIYEELRRRKCKIACVGIPKTVDNDFPLIDRSFGFDTAVQETQRAINCAKVEAEAAINGLGLVKVMGRASGQIAMFACLASRDVNVCLIPEIPFELTGDHGLLRCVADLFETKGHCVIVVAEGAGMDLISDDMRSYGTDASGNVKRPDIGLWLRARINEHFAAQGQEVNLKLIDPFYMVRSLPANATDSLYCSLLGQSAVHGAMAGYSGFSTGIVNGHHVMLPMTEICNRSRTRVDVHSRMWHRVLACTNQPSLCGSKVEEVPVKESGKPAKPMAT
ncbi:hypothetical protein BU14_0333s0011 [Porphyra umbilicalis]|uniref:Phosphofructokinase domain-containing protein n=1 Tax=Porphyra umbilicalis TaxID=2786 RepID=A0A1X6NYF5_PORUM|nr:hypothetical protein BU14_0333s0011 [Porphyra umbilicalis]|eukprot:OSX73622.1 hypothetical protein BU14_0333s0011 [Porphyra umbilicalis]